MPGALRAGDAHLCPEKEPGPVPHVGGPGGLPTPPAVLTVLVNGRSLLVVGDAALCVGRPDEIVGGISTVTADGRMVADSSAKTAHGGKFVTCSDDVRIG